MMTAQETFQLEMASAEAYEARFVPAMFAEWARELVAAAGVAPGQRVLDVACGTGIVARTAAEIVGPAAVTGVDINAAMLAVASRVRPEITWLPGDAAALPVPDEAFDLVLCQMALMFFPDPGAALREMARAAANGGTVGVVVPGRLEDQPAYGPFVDLVARHAGRDAASLLGVYWACGDTGRLRRLFAEAGLPLVEIATRTGIARYESADDFVAVEVESTPLAERLSAEQFELIRSGAGNVLEPFTDDDGGLAVPLQGHIVLATKNAD
ncbi:type 11 methyltransferase [Arthrobacter crystallopoietes BAB-32]|uniref:Type 11 methyltransferase n=1 Tax=Arthrobacter crystallopoietes BAB-32 TaxID=1246476 RepID=N1V182_9MICC|nr:methyltransferase domain-containing protein [Arthrobacter crystallopoietes]EMY33817.1 type 11 methyltransferase [Arthrobacter crystallopoietes BAB-32]